MLTALFLKGWMIGFFIAMPVGPIGLLCIRHSLIRGMLYGVAAGLGAALADTLYGGIASFGMTFISDFLVSYQLLLQILGSVFLCYLGISTLLSKPQKETTENETLSSATNIFFSTFILTLTNPLTVLSFAGIYAGFGIDLSEHNMISPLTVTFGVFVGSALWWLILSWLSNKIGQRLAFKPIELLNKVSGFLILGFGLIALTVSTHQVIGLFS